MRVLLIDNYDSFTYNLYHDLGDLGVTVEVCRNDAFTPKAVNDRYDAVVISPGPCTPAHTGRCPDLLALARPDLPILGVCLGHQLLFAHAGGTVDLAPTVRHGKTSMITHDESLLFAGIPRSFCVMRYHSLTAQEATTPACYQITARSLDDDQIMAIAHTTRPWVGVQFHPESCGGDYGRQVLANFLAIATAIGDTNPHHPPKATTSIASPIGSPPTSHA